MNHQLVDKSSNQALMAAPEAFNFECPMHVYKAATAPQGKQRRVAGIISTDNPDRQQEVILQDGMDFGDFLRNGWFNDNHSSGTTDILGYPETVSSFQAGDMLPDGQPAQTNCTWVDGYLLNTKKADDIWELAEALQGTNRRLGYSVEGSIEKRTGPGDRTIAKAKIRHVAITAVPVNTDARLEVLARSLSAINKAMSMCAGVAPGAPNLPVPDEATPGSGRALAREDLDTNVYGPYSRRKKRRKARKSLSPSEARAFVKSLGPDISEQTADLAVIASEVLLHLGLV
jgi:hypothetical protein